MKRIGNLYNNMLDEDNLKKVYQGVMKDKKGKYTPGTLSFMIRMNSDYYLNELKRIIYQRSYKPSKPRQFLRMERGKLRQIQAPRIFPDQFIHWSLMLQLEPILLRSMDLWCCASVKGRGTLYAKNYLEKKLAEPNAKKKYKYCLKMDIKKYFENIDRNILLDKLKRRIKDPEIIDLCSRIINSSDMKGLPLGYYTSQWFANYYLEEFDRLMRNKLLKNHNCEVYLRYMDDMIVFGSNKRELYKLMDDINKELGKIKLWLKNTSTVIDIDKTGFNFVGYTFNYGRTTLRKTLLSHIKDCNVDLYGKKFKIKSLRRSLSYNGWLTNSNSIKYKKNNLEGNSKLEVKHLVSMLKKLNEEQEKHPSSKTNNRAKIESEIIRLKEENKKRIFYEYPGFILVRVYGSEVRIVSRSKFVLPASPPPNRERYGAYAPYLKVVAFIYKEYSISIAITSSFVLHAYIIALYSFILVKYGSIYSAISTNKACISSIFHSTASDLTECHLRTG